MPRALAPGTWSDDPAYNNQEIDIEFSRWKNALDSSHSWRWTNRSIAFQSSAFGNSLAQ